jgi:hypothetical protein
MGAVKREMRDNFPLHSRGNNMILLKRCYALYLNFSRAANSVIVFDATHSTRVAQNGKVDQRGLMRISDCRLSFQIQAYC